MDKGYTLGELVISDGVFLGKQELLRQQLFLIDKTRLLLSLGGRGIVGRDDFSIQPGLTPGTIKVLESLAINKSGEIIHKREDLSIKVPVGNFRVACRAVKTSIEKGTVSLSVVDGVSVVTGVGTEFLHLFRSVIGQYKTTSISFSKKLSDETPLKNIGIYTVLQVISDTQLVLSESVYPEEGLEFKSIQTFSQDLLPEDDELQSIYKNYGCEILLIPESSPGVKPTLPESVEGEWEEDVFSLASIQNVEGVVTVTDKRETFYTKLEEFVQPSEWETLQLETGFSQDPGAPLSVRFSHFEDKIEIKGKFKTTDATGIVCVLPQRFRPSFETLLKCIKEQDSSELTLKVGVDGSMSLYFESAQFSGSTESNYVYPQILTIR